MTNALYLERDECGWYAQKHLLPHLSAYRMPLFVFSTQKQRGMFSTRDEHILLSKEGY